MQTRSGKKYTAPSPMEKVETKVENIVYNHACHAESSVAREPPKISNELAKFLGKPLGTIMSRTEVSRHIDEYIRTNNLEDIKCARIINCDSKLTSLLKIGKNDKVTYFNLQSYLKPHFVRNDL